MIKRICDCCGKEVGAVDSLESIWVGKGWRSRRLDACKACYKLWDKLKDKAIEKATNEFLKKKGCADIPEEKGE